MRDSRKRAKTAAIAQPLDYYLEKFFRESVEPTDTWLDVGAGDGNCSRRLVKLLRHKGLSKFKKAMNPQCLLLDLVPFPPHVKEGDGRDLSAYLDDSFDYVLLNRVFRTSAESASVDMLNEAARVAKKGVILQGQCSTGSEEEAAAAPTVEEWKYIAEHTSPSYQFYHHGDSVFIHAIMTGKEDSKVPSAAPDYDMTRRVKEVDEVSKTEPAPRNDPVTTFLVGSDKYVDGWYYLDDQADAHGPYATEEEAKAGFDSAAADA